MIRDMERGDIPAAAELISSVWFEGCRDCARTRAAYVEGVLSESSFALVWEEDGALLGMVSGRLTADCGLHMPSPGIAVALLDILIAGSGSESDLRALMETDSALLDRAAGAFDGELTMIVVSARTRDRGIGRALMNCAFSEFARRGAESVYAMADDLCDNGFLRSYGAERLACRGVELSRGTMGTSLYRFGVPRGSKRIVRQSIIRQHRTGGHGRRLG